MQVLNKKINQGIYKKIDQGMFLELTLVGYWNMWPIFLLISIYFYQNVAILRAKMSCVTYALPIKIILNKKNPKLAVSI